MLPTTRSTEIADFEEDDLFAGHHVLDFVNTCVGWGRSEPLDRLDSYIRLAQWSVIAGVMEPELADIIAMKGSLEPKEALEALENARALRAALHQIFSAYAQGAEPAVEDMETFEAFWQQSLAAHRLAFVDDHIEIRPAAFTHLTIVADLLARDAVLLMKDLPVNRLRLCSHEKCGWLYLVHNARTKGRYCGGRKCLNRERIK
ncbi:CGNR zinc finger domain-containing protein [Kordiimonas sp.]|uniref:CGNR zinc finger domain-containing protein n=1 Tax=Kordiimonas sp. TaxID=1970157 RepID=UPI003A8F655B